MPPVSRGPSAGSVASAGSEPGDALVLKIKLRLAAEPKTGAYRVTIELTEVCLTVEVEDEDLRRAVCAAANQCAECLRENGFTVTAPEVLSALEDALENSELVRTSTLN